MNLQGHKKHSLKELGVEGTEIHVWMDKPFSAYHSPKHRIERHTVRSAFKEVKVTRPDIIEKYGEKLVFRVIKDHVHADFRESSVPVIVLLKRPLEKLGLTIGTQN